MPSEVGASIEDLTTKFLPEKAGNARALFQLDLTGDGGGQWVLDIADGACRVREETAAQADAKVVVKGTDFVALFNGELDPMRAFMTGKIKASGNVGLLMQLLNWFERG